MRPGNQQANAGGRCAWTLEVSYADGLVIPARGSAPCADHQRAPVILKSLDWLARHGSWLIASGLFLGIAFPDVARLFRPLVGPCVFVLMVATVLRIDWTKVLAYVRRPMPAGVVIAWLLLGAPLIVWAATRILGLPDGLSRALVLTSCSPVLIAVPTFALMLGLDAALGLIAVIATSLLQPVLQPPLALLLLGIELDISVTQLMVRLAIFVGGAFMVALAIRGLAGRARIDRAAGPVSGVAVLMLIVFGVGVVDGLTETMLAQPGRVVLFALCAFAANFGLQAIGGALFLGLSQTRTLDRQQVLTTALATGNRNLAVLVAVLGDNADVDLLLFLAVNQFPMYFVPALLGPIYRRLLRPERGE
jgi:bile acid:Na+ symporter, BASS family